MNIGKNLQFLRRMRGRMTQEELAERMGVSRQTVSRWELGTALPELDKLIELCRLFGCTIDELVQGDMWICEEAICDLRTETLDEFRYISYAVISRAPEDDAISRMQRLAAGCGVADPRIIGWDFPCLSQEQVNVHHMHGYEAAWVLESGTEVTIPDDLAISEQPRRKYAVATVKNPFEAPFSIIPNAYKTLMAYMQANGIEHRHGSSPISCFEYSYHDGGTEYMDIYITAE